ncbi:MAG: S1 RNA-binding domain-containing protein [Lachnospiraceae bacterium]|nr:S1 RNA-binding domain-containing protein [Lachnospiraceae bacterium]
MSEEIRENVSEPELTMADFENEINASMKKYRVGDMVKGLVADIDEYLVHVDLGTYMQGVILPSELSDDPDYRAMDKLTIGQEISTVVINNDDGNGNLVLSLKDATKALAWETLRDGMLERKVYEVKISGAVNGGMVAYLEGIRGFIPISRVSMKRVEDSERDSYVGKKINVIIVEANEDKGNLILSARELEEEKAREEHDNKVKAIKPGAVVKGIIESIMPYGCFVNIGDGLSGLVHISQIAHKHIKTPHEVVKEGEEVEVKVIDTKDGKISLSMKALVDVMEKTETEDDVPSEYTSDEEATTGMASLLAGIKLD